MNYLLDTNVASDLIAEHAQVVARLAALDATDRVFICTIVRGEVLFGLGRLSLGKRRQTLEEKANAVLANIPCESIPPAAADAYAKVKLSRQQKGLPLDDNDCWIAATALAAGATLVSRDKDFQQIDGLSVVNWSNQQGGSH